MFWKSMGSGRPMWNCAFTTVLWKPWWSWRLPRGIGTRNSATGSDAVLVCQAWRMLFRRNAPPPMTRLFTALARLEANAQRIAQVLAP